MEFCFTWNMGTFTICQSFCELNQDSWYQIMCSVCLSQHSLGLGYKGTDNWHLAICKQSKTAEIRSFCPELPKVRSLWVTRRKRGQQTYFKKFLYTTRVSRKITYKPTWRTTPNTVGCVALVKCGQDHFVYWNDGYCHWTRRLVSLILRLTSWTGTHCRQNSSPNMFVTFF